MNVLVTGSSGLVGSEAVSFFDGLGFPVTGVDNNMRADFFGPSGDTRWVRDRLLARCRSFRHLDLDIRDREGVLRMFGGERFDLVVHAAAQPSHDLAAKRPLDDFDVNAVGTLNLLEACRRHSPEAVFVHLSSNKVYGDGPNRIRLKELETRWDYDDPRFSHGIAEDFPIDDCLHSLFGVSKAASDLMAQEYARYYGMKVGVFRGGCLTGSRHSGVELHGFLNYLIGTALRRGEYVIHGYKGKQVRDQIHAEDVVTAVWQFAQNPRAGEVYNIGGGKENSASVLECIELIARLTGNRPRLEYSDKNRVGDHICYYSDMRKFRSHYPAWVRRYDLPQIVEETVASLRVEYRT
jgi:CDP-paratose 2-epimerase